MDISNKASMWIGSGLSLLSAIVITPVIGMVRTVNRHEGDIRVLNEYKRIGEEDIKEIKQSQTRIEGKLDNFIARFVPSPPTE